MNTPNNRRRDPGGFGAETMMLAIGIGGVIATMVVLNVAVRLGHQLDGTGAELPTDPFAFTLGVIIGRIEWPASATCIVAVLHHQAPDHRSIHSRSPVSPGGRAPV